MPTQPETVNVTIYNTTYSLARPADQNSPDITELAEYVDAKMHAVSKRAELVSSTRVAVLAALEIAQELFEMRQDNHAEANTINTRIGNLLKTITDTS